MKYLIVDAYLNGSGIRDKYDGGYIDREELHLSSDLNAKIIDWLYRYWEEFYQRYSDINKVNILDDEGVEIARLLKEELQEVQIEYFSDAKMISVLILIRNQMN